MFENKISLKTINSTFIVQFTFISNNSKVIIGDDFTMEE